MSDATVFSVQIPSFYGRKAEFPKIIILTTFENCTVVKMHVVLIWITTPIYNLVGE